MKLIAYSSSESGGMNGGYSSTSVIYTDDGRCKVNIAGRTFHSQPTKRVTYYADGLLDKMSAVCEQYRVSDWTDLPDQKVFMYDAATSSDCFTFENGTKITLGSGKQYPENAREVFQEINKLIAESETYGVDVEITEEELFGTMGMMQLNHTVNSDKLQTAGKQETDTSGWAKFCADCGTEFTGNQKFCAECGSLRRM